MKNLPVIRFAGVFFAAVASAAPAVSQVVNDYPTVARADFVFACMKANGETREALEKCSCSIDVIATILPYENYETAASFMSVNQLQGEKGALFRQSEPGKKAIDDLLRARAEAEIRCF
jgi:hypothetical protein